MSENIVHFLVIVIQFYSLVVLARVVLSWLPDVSRANPLVVLIHQLTDPVLLPLREALPPMGGLDLSPLILLVGLHFLRVLLLNLAGGM